MVLDSVKVYRKAAGPDRAVESVPAQAAAQAKAGAYILGCNLRYRDYRAAFISASNSRRRASMRSSIVANRTSTLLSIRTKSADKRYIAPS